MQAAVLSVGFRGSIWAETFPWVAMKLRLLYGPVPTCVLIAAPDQRVRIRLTTGSQPALDSSFLLSCQRNPVAGNAGLDVEYAPRGREKAKPRNAIWPSNQPARRSTPIRQALARNRGDLLGQ
jgi:hypothetical protein